MKDIEIEFFHDVICSFCFPMSYEMRQLQMNMPGIRIKHRAYVLAADEADISKQFSPEYSHLEIKNSILKSWERANALDERKRFNTEKMKNEDFPFPTSMKPLRACQAGIIVADEEMYWDIFDSLQIAFYQEARNINDNNVIYDIIHSLPIDFEIWKKAYEDANTEKAIWEDNEIVKKYDISSVPTLVVNKKFKIVGFKKATELQVILQGI